jgi:formate dehydrogenase iron-sulfur subunit
MTMRIFVPRDAGAVAVGADEVATALEQAAGKSGITVEIVRTGSRGLYWLEPMVEVATPQGRIAFGPVAAADVPTVFDAMTAGGAHPLKLGHTDEIPWLKRQTRLTFARCGVIRATTRRCRELPNTSRSSGTRGCARRSLRIWKPAAAGSIPMSATRWRR